MFKWYNRWFILLFAVVWIVLGLRVLDSLSLFNIDKSSGTATQKYEWAIAPQDEEIKYRRHGFDVYEQKSDGGRTIAMYLKKGDETIISSQGDDIYGCWLSVDEYGIVRSWNSAGKQYSYAGVISLDDMPLYDFRNEDENSIFPEGTGYEDADSFSDGLAAVKENGLWGYVDMEGQYRIPPRYLSAGAFSNGYAYVIDQSGQGLVIDHAGEVISNTIGTYEEAGDYADGFFKVALSNHWYNLADLEGNLYLPNDGVDGLEYTDGVWRAYPRPGHPGFFFVRIERGGVFLPKCRKYISCDRIYVYDTVVIVNYKNKSTLYDKETGKILYQCKSISPFYEGLAVAEKGTRQTFINTQGQELFPARSVQLGSFSDGLAAITLANGTSGMIANPLIYDEWAADDSARASALGIEPIPAEFLSYGEMWDRLATTSERIYDAHAVFKTDDPDRYRVDVTEIRKSLELAGYPSEGVVDREHMAVALTAVASEYGIVTEGFLMFYGDKAEVTDDCESAMAYISTLCLFDMDGTNILPQKPVSGSEAQTYLLRFFERMIDQARYPFQG